MLTRPRVLAFAVLLIASYAAVGAQSPAGDRADRDYSQEAFVIEQSKTAYRFESDGTGRRLNQLRVRVQSDAGVQEWGQIVFGYNASTERVDIEFVRVRKADGSVVTAPTDAVQDLSSPVQRDAPVYTDFRQKHITVPSLRPGEIVEFSIAVEMHTPLAPGHFWLEHDFEDFAVVLDEQLEVDVPAERPLILRTAAGADPEIRDAGGRRVYRWTSAQTTPTADRLRELQENQDLEVEPAAIRLTTFQSWEEVGDWYAALEAPSRTVTPEIRAKALELTAGATTDLERLEALYDYVARDFRYVSISLGLGRYQPRAAADVLRDQYGDCKDKHTLLATLMASLGLPASTVLIHSELAPDPDFPSPSQFDHAITRAEVDGEAVWVDVTTEVAPFRLLASTLRGKQALVVAGGTARLEETPPDPPAGNLHQQEVEGTLNGSGTLTARVRHTFRGDLELLFRSVFHRAPPAIWRNVVQELDATAGVRGEVGEWTISDPRATKEPFVIEYQVTRTNFVDRSRRTAAVRLPVSDFSLPRHDGESELDLGEAGDVVYRLQLDLDEELTARAPVPVSISRDYGNYRAAYTLDGRRFTAERTLRLTTRSLPADRSSDYAAFVRVITADAAQVLSLDLPASAPVVTDSALETEELFRNALQAMRSGNNTQAISLLERVVEANPQHQTAWSGLGLARAATDDLDGALEAFTRQIEINPFHESAYNTMGSIYVSQRRYEEAEAAFLKQLEVNPLDPRSPALLGQLYLEMERYSDAAAQFERAVAIAPENAGLHVERGRAYLSLDRDDEALAAFARALEISPGAGTWNNVAYHLAEAGVHLDRAQQYAESAVAAVTADSRNFTIDSVTARELGVVQSMASYWDTLGWVFFKQGDLANAERLIEASWRLAQNSVLGDHLAQIYERQGRRDDAIRTYAAALATERPDPAIRERLAGLVPPARIDALVRDQASELAAQRTVAVAPGDSTGSADFFVLIGPAGVEGVSFIEGDEALRGMSDAIRAADFKGLLPEAPAKLLRRGVLGCSTAAGRPTCSFVLLPSGDARAADAPR